jgi:cytosine/adenosine deaminase-related metal-dependent hydrolase
MLLQNGWICPMDDSGSEAPDGWVLVRDGLVEAVGGGAPPAAETVVDLAGAVVTPGLVNTHHHLYQTLTRARAQEATLFEWLRELYPVWARIDDEMEYAAARTGLAELALTGCTTVFDHHYVFPRGVSGLVEGRSARRDRRSGLPPRAARRDPGESDGGLPPDSLVESNPTRCCRTELPGLQDDAARPDRVAPCLAPSVTGRADERVGRAGPSARAAVHAPRGDRRGG